jgi:hypothetical protein
MPKLVPLEKQRISLAIGTVVVLLFVTLPRRSHAEDLADFKAMYYMEDNDRIHVFSPTVSYQKEISSTLTIKIDGIYNSISGATPTGAPPIQSAPAAAVQAPASSSSSSPASSSSSLPTVQPAATPASSPRSDDEGDDGGDDRRILSGVATGITRLPYAAKAGATPAPTPAPTPTPAPVAATPVSSPKPKPHPATPATVAAPVPTPAAAKPPEKVPTADFSDERYAGNIELIKKIENHTVSGLLSYSTESDYDSVGVGLKDGIDFNQKNTTLILGGAYTHDTITPANGTPAGSKDSTDLLIGLTQVIDPRTLFTIDFTLGQVDGLLTDPYKVVELNGQLVGEKRPDSKDKKILYLSLAHFFPVANGSLEGSYRFYTDTFGIDAHTVQLAWFQKLGTHWVLRPQVRFYDQSQADFYDVRFTGAPDFYSSDYRVSALDSVGAGLKLIWMPNTRFQIDAEYMRYEQFGKDGVTSDDAYPSANAFILGARIWL